MELSHRNKMMQARAHQRLDELIAEATARKSGRGEYAVKFFTSDATLIEIGEERKHTEKPKTESNGDER